MLEGPRTSQNENGLMLEGPRTSPNTTAALRGARSATGARDAAGVGRVPRLHPQANESRRPLRGLWEARSDSISFVGSLRMAPKHRGIQLRGPIDFLPKAPPGAPAFVSLRVQARDATNPSRAARTTDQRAQRSAALVLAARTFSRSEMAGGSATDPVAALQADEGSGDVGAAPEDLAGRVLAPGGCSAAPFGAWATRRR